MNTKTDPKVKKLLKQIGAQEDSETNMMSLQIQGMKFSIDINTMKGNLVSLWNDLNNQREEKGLGRRSISAWLADSDLADFVEHAEVRLNGKSLLDLTCNEEGYLNCSMEDQQSTLFETSGDDIWCSLMILIKAAMHLDPDFEASLILGSEVEDKLNCFS